MNKTNKTQRFIKWFLTVLFVIALPFAFNVQAQSLSDLIEQARAAGIEQSRIADLQNRAEARGISEADLLEIIRPAVAMAEQNLPYEMIFEKAFEGISKRVPVQRMRPVLNSIAESSAEAAVIIDPWVENPAVGRMLERSGQSERSAFRDNMVRAGSKNLMQNFDREVLEETLQSVAGSRVMERASPSGIITAFNILSDLPEAAQQPAETARIVISALEGGFDASDLQKLPGAMSMAQRRSQLPAQAVAEGLARQLQGGLPASQILQNLFNGDVIGGPPGNIPPGRDRQGPPDRRQGPPN
jgi:hypothetical protein